MAGYRSVTAGGSAQLTAVPNRGCGCETEESDDAEHEALVRIVSRVCCRRRIHRGGGRSDRNFRFAHTIGFGDAQTLAAEEFAKKVAQKTGNAVQIDLFPAGQLGNDPKVMEGVKLGTIDMGMTGNPFFTSFSPELNVFDLPYLFRDFDHVYKVLDGPIGAEMRLHLEKHGFKVLGGLEIGFRNVTNNKRPIKTPDDLKGLKLRTTPNPAHLQAFRLLGADPVPMPFTEVYLALKTGAVDGQENPIAHIYASKFHEVQKYHVLDLPRVHDERRRHEPQEVPGSETGAPEGALSRPCRKRRCGSAS